MTTFYQAAIREREKKRSIPAFKLPPFLHALGKNRTYTFQTVYETNKRAQHTRRSIRSCKSTVHKIYGGNAWKKKKKESRTRKRKKREKGYPFENGSQNGIVTHGMPRLAIETGAWEHDRPIHGSHAIHSATVRPISGDPTRATEHTVQHSNPSSRPTLRKEACVVLPFPHKTLSNTRVHIYLNTHAVVCARAYITATTTLCNTRHTRVHTRGLRLRKRAKEQRARRKKKEKLGLLANESKTRYLEIDSVSISKVVSASPNLPRISR